MADWDGGRSHLTFCREILGWGSAAFFDHFVARLHVGMVAIRQAATAWLFATKCLV